ncbi:DUF6093 family protein [Streptomyces sp. NPDC058661]
MDHRRGTARGKRGAEDRRRCGCAAGGGGRGAIVWPGQLLPLPPLDAVVAPCPAPTAYQALLPLSVPAVLADDELNVTRSVRDEQLFGRRFWGTEVAVGTYAVVRVVRLEMIECWWQPCTRDSVELAAALAGLGSAVRARAIRDLPHQLAQTL